MLLHIVWFNFPVKAVRNIEKGLLFKIYKFILPPPAGRHWCGYFNGSNEVRHIVMNLTCPHSTMSPGALRWLLLSRFCRTIVYVSRSCVGWGVGEYPTMHIWIIIACTSTHPRVGYNLTITEGDTHHNSQVTIVLILVTKVNIIYQHYFKMWLHL